MNFDFELYTEYFGLTQRPFTLVPDPAFVFWSRTHLKARAILEFGLINRSPITMITGKIGSGKTTILREILNHMNERITVGLVANAIANDRADMLRLILHALGRPIDSEVASYSTLYRQLEAVLVEEYSKGSRVALIFDEAQNLGHDALEHLRMLTNINFADHELVQLFLVGQPELRDVVMRSDMVQLAQRISANVFLPGLTEEDVPSYIQHRLSVAGATRDLFDPDTFPLIFKLTDGTPRLINQLCDFALLYAYVEDEQIVTTDTINRVLDEQLFFCGGRGMPLILVHSDQETVSRRLDERT